MPTGAITGYVDVAQVVLYAFFIFFAGLVFWIRREDRREGYPLEAETVGRRKAPDPVLIPKPKAFHLPGGETTYAPQRDTGIETGVPARKLEPWPGAPYAPTDERRPRLLGAPPRRPRPDLGRTEAHRPPAGRRRLRGP